MCIMSSYIMTHDEILIYKNATWLFNLILVMRFCTENLTKYSVLFWIKVIGFLVKKYQIEPKKRNSTNFFEFGSVLHILTYSFSH